jgi:hypothetical protein
MSKPASSTSAPKPATPPRPEDAAPPPDSAPLPRFTGLQPADSDGADGARCGPDGCHAPAPAEPPAKAQP